MGKAIVKFEIPSVLKQIKKEAEAMLCHAKEAIKIRTQGDKVPAVDFLSEVKKKIKLVKEERDKIIKPVKVEINGFDENVKKITIPLVEAEKITKRKIAIFDEEQEKINSERQRKLDERAIREEEKEKAKFEAQAKNWEEKENFKKAEERRMMAEKTFIPSVILPKVETHIKTEKGSISTSKDYIPYIINLKALLAWLSELEDPSAYVNIKVSPLKAYRKATGFEIPGVRFEEIKTVSVTPA